MTAATLYKRRATCWDLSFSSKVKLCKTLLLFLGLGSGGTEDFKAPLTQFVHTGLSGDQPHSVLSRRHLEMVMMIWVCTPYRVMIFEFHFFHRNGCVYQFAITWNCLLLSAMPLSSIQRLIEDREMCLYRSSHKFCSCLTCEKWRKMTWSDSVVRLGYKVRSGAIHIIVPSSSQDTAKKHLAGTDSLHIHFNLNAASSKIPAADFHQAPTKYL